METLGFKHAEIQKEGRPPYAPSDLLKLYMYGYKHGIRSSRKLEHSSKVNIDLWWILKGLRPSFRCIAYFRKNNALAIRSAFRHLVVMLQGLDLIEGDTIAIDTFKIRAQNSMRNNYSQKRIDRQVAYIDAKIIQYEQQLEHADKLEEQAIKSKVVEKRSGEKNTRQ